MSRNKKSKPAPVTADCAAPAAPADLAEAALAAGRCKDAIEQFKGLLKGERRPAWLAGLAAAYAGRAEQLAAKGMLKEAVALWRTRAETCQVALLGGPYVGWLLQSGQTAQALGLMAGVAQLPADDQASALSQLAAAALVAPDAQLAGLPAHSPLLLHRAAAQAAVAACVSGDAPALDTALQAISFKSPYRDLRPLLKALALLASAPDLAQAALARVTAGGPFEPLAKGLRIALLPGVSWLPALAQLDDAGRRLVLDLKGCPPAQRPLMLDLMARLGDHKAVTAVDVFDWIVRHRVALDSPPTPALARPLARPLCLRLLPHVPQRLNAFNASFAAPLTPTEESRVLALAEDLKDEPYRAEQHWLGFVTLQAASPVGRQRGALVLRRLADAHKAHGQDGQLCGHALDWLKQSLAFDPSDRDTHLSLLRHARAEGDLKQARAWLERAQQALPGDVQLMQQAVEIALDAGAFKKAAGLAKQVLALDPINPQVRTLIGQAHLSHARKLIKAANLAAALRELDQAADWLRSTTERGQIKLLRGLASPSGRAGDLLLREALAEWGAPLLSAFHLLLEGKHTHHPPADLLRRAAVDLKASTSAAELVGLAQTLNSLPVRHAAAHAALLPLRGALGNAAATLQLADGEYLQVCEALHRQAQSDLTLRFAQAALQRWPQRPLYLYFAAAGRHGGQPGSLAQGELQRLERALEQARSEGDQRTATRIGKLLRETGFGWRGAYLPDDLADEPDDVSADDVRATLDIVLAGSGGVDRFLEVARRQLGKAIFDNMRRTIKGSKQEFAEALVELLAAEASDQPGSAGPSRAARPSAPSRPPEPSSPGAWPGSPRTPPASKSSAPAPAPIDKHQPDLFDD